MAHDPLSPAEALRTRLGLALIALSVLVLAYSFIIVNQILVGLWFVAFTAGLYLIYRVIVVLDSIADAAQRVATVREAEVNTDDESTDL